MDISDISAAPIPKWTPSSPSNNSLYAPDGQIIVPGRTGPIYLGSGHQMQFEDENLQGWITPALAANVAGLNMDFDGKFSSLMPSSTAH